MACVRLSGLYSRKQVFVILRHQVGLTRWAWGVVAVGLLALLTACGSSEETPTAPEQDVTADYEIVMNDMRFEPAVISGAPGETLEILLRNTDTVVHDFTVDDLDGESTQIELQPRQELSFSLNLPDEPGEWEFYCSIPGHRQLGMVGVIQVQE